MYITKNSIINSFNFIEQQKAVEQEIIIISDDEDEAL